MFLKVSILGSAVKACAYSVFPYILEGLYAYDLFIISGVALLLFLLYIYLVNCESFASVFIRNL